jgi:hypothetical protein
MRVDGLRSYRWACGLWAGVAAAACTVPPLVAPTSAASQPQRYWLSPLAAAQSRAPNDIERSALLYVAESGWNTDVFSYPSGELKGRLDGFGAPRGLCVDRSGNVFVTDLLRSATFEYAHGSAEPKLILEDKPYSKPNDCSIDPITGNLAVAHVADYNLGIAIYRHARGAPKFYSDPNFYEYFNCGYDPFGNLFIDGLDHSLAFLAAELPKASSSFIDLTFRRLPRFSYSGGIKWDGKYVAIDNLDGSTIYQVRVRGAVATVVGSTRLANGAESGEFWFPGLKFGENGRQAARVIATGAGVSYWNYPSGGLPTKTIPVGGEGVTVSPPQR